MFFVTIIEDFIKSVSNSVIVSNNLVINSFTVLVCGMVCGIKT